VKGPPAVELARTEMSSAPAVSDAATALSVAQRLCEALFVKPARRKAECCGRAEQPPLLDACVSTLETSLRAQALSLESAAVSACEVALDTALTGCDWVGSSLPPTPAACQGLFVGHVLGGGACRSSLECAGALHCEGVSPTRSGTCTAPAPLGAGCGAQVDALASYTLQRDLASSHPMCQDFCSLAQNRCEPVPAAGQSCQASVNCAPGQSCSGGRCSEPTAAPRARPGEACRTHLDCAVGGCVEGAGGQRTCGAQCTAPLAALGASAESARMRLPFRPQRTVVP
jgi:hypothetical protein